MSLLYSPTAGVRLMYENGAIRVYVSGPYSQPDPVENTHKAVSVASRLLNTGFIVPLVPHLTMFWHAMYPRDYEQWLAYDLKLVEHADAVYRLHGESPGADRECAYANSSGIPVFLDYDFLMEWCIERIAEGAE